MKEILYRYPPHYDSKNRRIMTGSLTTYICVWCDKEKKEVFPTRPKQWMFTDWGTVCSENCWRELKSCAV